MEGYLELFCNKCGGQLLVEAGVSDSGPCIKVEPCQFCMGENKQLRKAIATVIEAAHKPFGR